VFLEKPRVFGENPGYSSSRWEKPRFQFMSYNFVGSRFPRQIDFHMFGIGDRLKPPGFVVPSNESHGRLCE